MIEARIPERSWVLICDGSKALVLRNDGDAANLKLTQVYKASEHHPPTRDLGADRQGRVFQSHGAAHSTTEETDWHAQAEEMFLKGVAEDIDTLVRENSIKNLVLIAPPKALGIMRRQLAPATLGIIVAEIDHDLVKMPVSEIEKYLS